MSQYIENELLKIAPFPIWSDDENGQYKLKLSSDKGETKWLNIDKDTMARLEILLSNMEGE